MFMGVNINSKGQASRILATDQFGKISKTQWKMSKRNNNKHGKKCLHPLVVKRSQLRPLCPVSYEADWWTTKISKC